MAELGREGDELVVRLSAFEKAESLDGGSTALAVVHHDTPWGVQVRLAGMRFDGLLISCNDPEAAKRQLDGGR
jgi:hypothetical protein